VSLKHAILVLLEQDNASGYDLHKRFQQHMGFFWQASHQQIYSQLKKLSEGGLILMTEHIQQGKPDRKEYSISDTGREELVSWMQQLSKPMKVNDSLLVKLYGGHLSDPQTLLTDLQQQQQSYEKSLAVLLHIERQYLALSETEKQPYKLPYLTLRRGIYHVKGWLAWAAEARKMIAELDAEASV